MFTGKFYVVTIKDFFNINLKSYLYTFLQWLTAQNTDA